MISVNLYWWFIPIILFAAPFVYTWLRGEGGDYDMAFDVAIIFIGCWSACLAFLIGALI